jgi:hypothetical protein
VPRFLVEVFAPSLGVGDLAAAEERARAAATRVSGRNAAVRYLRATYVPEDETCFHVFEAPSAELVAQASALAGRRAARETKEDTMGTTFKRLVGLGFVAAALASGTATASNTPQGLKADGLRLQGIAEVYKQMPSPQGLKADGQRLQGIAQVYERMQTPPAASFYTPRALKAEGLRGQAMARAYGADRPAVRSSSSSGTRGFDWGAALVGAASMLGFGTVGVALLLGARRVRRTKVAV